MQFYPAVMALQVLAFVFRGFLQPPLTLFTDLFAAPTELHLLLYLVVFAFFGRSLEEEMGSNWFAASYVAGALAGNLLTGPAVSGFTAASGGSGAGIMALIGVLVALKPLTFVVAEYFPLPAFVAAVFFIFVKFVLDSSLDVVPLFIGIAFGYVIKETRAQPPTAAGGPAQPWARH